MAELTLTDAAVWLDGLSLQSVSNSLSLEMSVDVPDATTFADGGWRTRAEGGLKTSTVSVEGWYDAEVYDAAMFDALGDGVTLTMSAPGANRGDVAYIVPSAVGGYTISGSVGDLLAVTLAAEGAGEVFRPTVLTNTTGLTPTAFASSVLPIRVYFGNTGTAVASFDETTFASLDHFDTTTATHTDNFNNLDPASFVRAYVLIDDADGTNFTDIRWLSSSHFGSWTQEANWTHPTTNVVYRMWSGNTRVSPAVDAEFHISPAPPAIPNYEELDSAEFVRLGQIVATQELVFHVLVNPTAALTGSVDINAQSTDAPGSSVANNTAVTHNLAAGYQRLAVLTGTASTNEYWGYRIDGTNFTAGEFDIAIFAEIVDA